MNQKTLSRVLVYFILLLLVLQSLYCFEMASSFASMFRGAQNVRPADSLPRMVWWYVGAGCLWLGVGVAFLFNTMQIRRWFVLLSVVAFLYGLKGYRQSAPVLLSWFGVFHGDIVALETASSAIFCLMGIVGFFHWVVDRNLL
jgi:hypothetical protein